MSAELDDRVRAEAKRMRAFDVLSKPVRMQHLADVIGHVLESVYDWRLAMNNVFTLKWKRFQLRGCIRLSNKSTKDTRLLIVAHFKFRAFS